MTAISRTMAQRVDKMLSPYITYKKLHGRWWVDKHRDWPLAKQFPQEAGLDHTNALTDAELDLVLAAAGMRDYSIETIHSEETT